MTALRNNKIIYFQSSYKLCGRSSSFGLQVYSVRKKRSCKDDNEGITQLSSGLILQPISLCEHLDILELEFCSVLTIVKSQKNLSIYVDYNFK